jgi:uncharacterized protein (DUF2249 family)
MQVQSGPADASATVELDVRGIQPPAHIFAILKTAGDLPRGTSLRVRLDDNPAQLYDLLQQRGFFFDARKKADGSYEAAIRENGARSTIH